MRTISDNDRDDAAWSAMPAESPPREDTTDEAPTWAELKRRHTFHLRLVATALVAGALAAGVCLMLWNAESHYRDGRRALGDGRYGTAVEAFAAARLLWFGYKDAEALGAEARSALDNVSTQTFLARQRQRAVTRLLRGARESVAAGDAAAVTAAVHEIRVLVPSGPIPVTDEAAGLAERLRDDLTRGTRAGLADGRWSEARQYALALLALDPANEIGVRLRDRAGRAVHLQPKLDAARAAARRGKWRRALRLARAVLDSYRGFPGAAAIVVAARSALAPEPSPKPQPTATATAASTTPQAPVTRTTPLPP